MSMFVTTFDGEQDITWFGASETFNLATPRKLRGNL